MKSMFGWKNSRCLLTQSIFLVGAIFFVNELPAGDRDIHQSCSLDEGVKLEYLADNEQSLAESLLGTPQEKDKALKQSEESAIHFKHALEHYVCASKAGDHQASLKAARLMGSGMVESVSDAVIEKYLLDAANADVAEGQLMLSGYYCWGKFTGCKNRDKAWYWMNRAAKNKNLIALGELVMAYEHGDSVPKNMRGF